MRLIKLGAAALTAGMGASGAGAATIVSGPEGWNVDNVAVGTGPDAEGTFFSVIYDRAPTDPGAETYGRITFDDDEAFSPGVKVMNGPDQGSFGTTTLPGVTETSADNASNCIMASSDSWCDGPRRTGKRWKQQITRAGGAMDLVFDVDATGTDETEYRGFHRLVNVTGEQLAGFRLELGFGVGSSFTASTSGDGLRLAPRGAQNPTQFPFGLFGEEGSRGRIGGFFDATARAGFGTSFDEDSITTGAIFGAYDDYFGSWISQEDAPEGLLWDDDGDPTTDALLMAYLVPETGEWEQRRVINSLGEAETLVADPDVRGPSFASIEDVELFFDDRAWTLDGVTFFQDLVEDVANLNVNYFIYTGDATQWSTFDGTMADFTLRVTAQPVPVPAALPLLGAGVAALAGLGLRRRRAHG